MTSVVNVSAAQSLLAEEFDIMFREFHMFVLIGTKIEQFVSRDLIKNLCSFGVTGIREWAKKFMPQVISETMDKIIRGETEEKQTEEESKKAEQDA